MGQKPPSKSGLEGGWGWIIHPHPPSKPDLDGGWGLEGGWGWIIHPHPPSKPDLDGRVPHDGDGWAILGAVTMDHICAGGAAHHPECRKYCCLPNFGRCGRSQDRVSINCLLADPLYPVEWMAETQFRTVDHSS